MRALFLPVYFSSHNQKTIQRSTQANGIELFHLMLVYFSMFNLVF